MKTEDNTPTPRPNDDSEAAGTKRRILEAALVEFAEQGVAGARVDRIAERAGVNKALLYYYYGKKQHLYEETLTAYMRDTVTAARLRLEGTKDLQEALTAVAHHYQMAFLARPEIPRLLLRELADPGSALVPRWAERIRESGIPTIIRGLLEQERSDGRLREFELRQAIVSFITMQLGYYLMAPLINRVLQITDYEDFVKQRGDAVVDLFLNGVKTR